MTTLPPLYVYLLLDVSASMHGAALEALKQGVHLLQGVFSSQNKREILMSAISYDSEAKQIVPLTEKTRFHLPILEVGGTSGLGGALRVLDNVLAVPDHHPTMVYLFTDGDPTDDWEKILPAIQRRVDKMIGLACGWTINEETLRAITPEAYSLDELTSDGLFATMRMFV